MHLPHTHTQRCDALRAHAWGKADGQMGGGVFPACVQVPGLWLMAMIASVWYGTTVILCVNCDNIEDIWTKVFVLLTS